MNDFNNFPQIELFYEQIYKKIPNYSLMMVIPIGQKCFIWFKNNSCIIINLSISSITNNRKIYSISNSYCKNNEFNNLLGEGNGTILYGTIFNNNYFAIEDIFYYKNRQLSSDFLNKLNIINVMLKHEIYMSQQNYILFGIPFIQTSNNLQSNTISYEIDELKYIINDKTLYFKTNSVPLANAVPLANSITQIKYNKKIFKIKATLKSDIYNLYQLNKNTNDFDFYDIAFIPNYKTSVMMNKIFRNLKEHSNLDYLEESDDEDNVIDFDISYNMECLYNNKFNKWVPLKVVE